MSYIVVVEYVNYDDVTTEEHFGPFASRETAQRFQERATGAIKTVQADQHGDRVVYVHVRPVYPPRIRPIRKEAARFTGEE